MAQREYLSIGEVLGVLKGDFPDVTISKIRFLEAQGLVDPERTPSGYRKFRDADVERLRFVLTQQREHFLPLKVIKGRLGAGWPAPAGAPSSSASAAEPAERAAEAAEAADEVRSGAERALAALAPPEAPARRLSADEVAAATGLDADHVDELERFGLLGPDDAGSYDEAAVAVARAYAGFLRHGVEARHLRMYRTTTEREAAFYDQVVAPLRSRRDADARDRAEAVVRELVGLGEELRLVLLARALRGGAGAR